LFTVRVILVGWAYREEKVSAIFLLEGVENNETGS
jgi:hypothetical protein